MAAVTYSMCASGERMSDQSQVSDAIAEKSRRLKSASPTGAMEAIYSINAASIDRYVAACQPADHQVGALFVVNGKLLGFDLFDRPSTLRRMLPKLLRSAAVDAIDPDFGAPADKGPHTARTLVSVLASVAEAERQVVPALGIGEDAPDVGGIQRRRAAGGEPGGPCERVWAVSAGIPAGLSYVCSSPRPGKYAEIAIGSLTAMTRGDNMEASIASLGTRSADEPVILPARAVA